jgi:hypothetical protein
MPVSLSNIYGSPGASGRGERRGLIEKIKRILETDDDLDFLLGLKKGKLKGMVPCIRERADQAGGIGAIINSIVRFGLTGGQRVEPHTKKEKIACDGSYYL